MGGPGSGRHLHCNAARCTDDYYQIDVRRWHRDGLLEPGQSFGWHWVRNNERVASVDVWAEDDRMMLSRPHTGGGDAPESEEHEVWLDWTPCTYGGWRAWFVCPRCGRRVAILYGGGVFACRHCHQLAYQSQRENADVRAARRADTIRGRLSWAPGILNGLGDKPKWMRWRTFERLLAEHDAFVRQSLSGIRCGDPLPQA